MISKEKEDYLFKLKAELLFRGKDEHEVNDIIEELRDHFELAEKNHDDRMLNLMGYERFVLHYLLQEQVL